MSRKKGVAYSVEEEELIVHLRKAGVSNSQIVQALRHLHHRAVGPSRVSGYVRRHRERLGIEKRTGSRGRVADRPRWEDHLPAGARDGGPGTRRGGLAPAAYRTAWTNAMEADLVAWWRAGAGHAVIADALHQKYGRRLLPSSIGGYVLRHRNRLGLRSRPATPLDARGSPPVFVWKGLPPP